MADPAELNPLFVVSPNARCGITLVQRLLNSSRRILVYGENAFLLEALPNHLLALSISAAQHTEAREKLLAGDYDFWSSSLWPSVSAYQEAGLEAIKLLLSACGASARADGFDRWGIKNPIREGRHIQLLHDSLPGARFVFIYRHVGDVIASQKARRWLPTLDRIVAEARRWNKVIRYMLSGSGSPRVLVIRYEQMLAHREDHAAALEQFAGVEGIDRAVFDRKVNTFSGEQKDGHSPTQYIPPEPLTEPELAALAEVADPLLSELDYPSIGQWHAERTVGELKLHSA